MSGMSHAKQAAAWQECNTGILKSRRYWSGQRELKVAPGYSDRGFVGSVIHSYHTLKPSDDAIINVSVCLQFAHNSFQDTTHLLST